MIVYDIGDFKLTHMQDHSRFTFKGDPECYHRKLTYRAAGDIITCDDCKRQVTPAWAFLHLVQRFADIQARLQSERKQLEQEKARTLTDRAAVRVQDAWRRRKYVPTCPHCHKGILPEQGFGNSGNRTSDKQNAKPIVMQPCLHVVNEGADAEPA